MAHSIITSTMEWSRKLIKQDKPHKRERGHCTDYEIVVRWSRWLRFSEWTRSRCRFIHNIHAHMISEKRRSSRPNVLMKVNREKDKDKDEQRENERPPFKVVIISMLTTSTLKRGATKRLKSIFAVHKGMFGMQKMCNLVSVRLP